MSNNFEKEKQGNQLKEPVFSQTHSHEFLGSTKLAGAIVHNHRFAGVTSEVIPITGGNHIHGILVNTDFAVGHLHEVAVETGPAIVVETGPAVDVGGGKHVHFVTGTTTLDAGHVHEFEFATLIDNPLG